MPPTGLAAQTPHQANPPPDDRIDPIQNLTSWRMRTHEELPIYTRCLSLAQQKAQYRVVPHNPEITLSPFAFWQQKYDISGGTPDTNFVEVECNCHATLGRSLEFISPSEARCSRTQLVSFRHLDEDYEKANMCSECWPHLRRYGVDLEYHRCYNASRCTCDSCRVIL